MSDSLESPSSRSLCPKDGDQYREYFIPCFNASEEAELLREYNQNRLTDALRSIYSDFYMLIDLMRGYAQSRQDTDFTYALLAEKLQHPLSRLSKACSATVDWQLIKRTTVGEQS